MFKTTITTTGAIVLLALAGCGESSKPAPESTDATMPDDTASTASHAASELAGTDWELVVIQSMDDTEYRPTEPGQFTMSFGDDSVRIKAACNRANGSYESAGPGQLQFGPLAMTKALCGPEPIHARFESDLGYIRSYVWRDGHLFLATMADGSILEFKPLGAPSSKANPTFDCEKADGSVEEMICDQPDLARLDQEMDSLYKKVVGNVGEDELKTLKAFQRGWIKGRNDCWKADNVHECVKSEYELRITELQIMAGDQMVPSPKIYNCDNGEVLTVYFYNETKLRSAVLNLANDQIKAYASVDKSGYHGQNVELQNTDGGVTLTWLDKNLNCTAA